MVWTTVTFGKHEGKTLPQIAFSDPDWLRWAVNKGIFTSKRLASEAKDVARKAQRIAIPKDKAGKKKVRYYFQPGTGRLGNIEIIDADRGPHSGSSSVVDSQGFDLFVASKHINYDKAGGKDVVNAVKYHVFGNGSTRITKKKAETFFDDPNNFY